MYIQIDGKWFFNPGAGVGSIMRCGDQFVWITAKDGTFRLIDDMEPGESFIVGTEVNAPAIPEC